jgi:hypothetical protein
MSVHKEVNKLNLKSEVILLSQANSIASTFRPVSRPSANLSENRGTTLNVIDGI